ncbi:MAG: hypothetical protein QNJ41_00195 [Xenococcaceae cyanobacterium MO_188.B32]|nr:hypothetical protein [Xenococcaceae cyanobacterium MO_188.B32]
MSIAIIQITQEELAARAIKINSEKLTFENQVFAKGPSFSLRCKEPALKYCQQIAKRKLKILLIQEKYGFTIWTQSHVSENLHSNRKKCAPQISSTKAKQQSVYSSKISEKERSKVDEVSQKDSQKASTDNNFLRKMLLRKYRGQYIN